MVLFAGAGIVALLLGQRDVAFLLFSLGGIGKAVIPESKKESSP